MIAAAMEVAVNNGASEQMKRCPILFNGLFKGLQAFLLLVYLACAMAADNGDFSRIEGIYQGEVFNGGNLDPMTTTFSLGKNGRLLGHYLVEDEAGLMEGTMSNARLEGPYRFSMEWTDKYGEGYLEIRFSPDFSSFEGFWSPRDRQEHFPMNGYKDKANN